MKRSIVFVLFLAAACSAQPSPKAWKATPEEVRDIERLRSAQAQINVESKALIVRVQTRLNTSGLTYDDANCAWVASGG
jgi:hypothetical protein